MFSDTSKIFVNAGLGFYVEMTLKECLEFLDQKEKFYDTNFDKEVERCTRIKAKIHEFLYLLDLLRSSD